ncbi:MAG: hypothetical protein WD991_01575 [Candidatus Paceibacterota bacterium]
MKKFIKENIVLVMAFAVPVLLIVAVALSTYLPSLFLKTEYDFIYTTCANNSGYTYYACPNLSTLYTVVGNKLVVNPGSADMDQNKNGTPDIQEGYTFRIFLHDTTRNESREITQYDAGLLLLSPLLTSPDGVTVSYSSNRDAGFFIFGGSSDYGNYLVKGKSKQKLNLINSGEQYYYSGNFQFIGWVLSKN